MDALIALALGVNPVVLVAVGAGVAVGFVICMGEW